MVCQESFLLLSKKMDILLKKENILILSKSDSEAKVSSIKVHQTTYSSVLYHGRESFAESFSSSMLFSSFQRQYDEGAGKVKILTGKKKEELFSSPMTKTVNYQEYEENYGKLLRLTYDSPLEKRRMQNLFIEEIDEESIKVIHHNSSFFDISPDIARMYPYYQKQIKENGDFDELPNIKEAELKIDYDGDFLTGKEESLHYLVRYGLFRLDIQETTRSHIFILKDDSIAIRKKTYPIIIPKENEEFLDYENVFSSLDS